MAGEAKPENVDGDSVVDEWEMGRFARDWVPTVAAYGESGWNFDRARGCVSADTGDGSVSLLDEAGSLPAHAKCERREARCFGGEKVEEVPLRHESDEFGLCGEVREVGYVEALATDDGREAGDLGVGNSKEFVEEAELMQELKR